MTRRRLLNYLVSALIGQCLVSAAGYGVTIDAIAAREIESCLARGSASTVCEYPSKALRKLDEPLIVTSNITWSTPATLALVSKEDVVIKLGTFLISLGQGPLALKAGMENEHNRDYHNVPVGRVLLEGLSPPQVNMNEGGITIYYNPEQEGSEHKFWSSKWFFYRERMALSHDDALKTYMLINHERDLQDITYALCGDYALSQDIDASDTVNWDQGEGFWPLWDPHKGARGQAFSGNFDGNGFTIANLYINRPYESKVGIFGKSMGVHFAPNTIQNLIVRNATIVGNRYVGGLIGDMQHTSMRNVAVLYSTIKGSAAVGGLVGAATGLNLEESFVKETSVFANVDQGLLFGTVNGGHLSLNMSYLPTRVQFKYRESEGEKYFEGPLGIFMNIEELCVDGCCIPLSSVGSK